MKYCHVNVFTSMLILLYSIGCLTAVQAEEGAPVMSLTLNSSDFQHQGDMPARLTCDGADLSPALMWSGAPEQAESLVLIVDDPDAPDPAAPKMTWVHWLLYNIPLSATALPEAVTQPNLPQGALIGKNDWGRNDYGGPCPPIGRHRYFYKLYALDVMLPDLKSPNKAQLEKAMQGHIIESAELIGLYQRSR